MAVFVLDRKGRPLMPCTEKRARLMLERGRARVHRMVPFTIRLVDRLLEDSELQPTRIKLDPGSKTTGIALVRDKDTVDSTTGETTRTVTALMLLELQHRGGAIRKALEQRRGHRRFRRSKMRYRPARFNNRTRPSGLSISPLASLAQAPWLAPSLQHRVDTTMSWVVRLCRLAPVTALSQELVRFDIQSMQNPEISGIEYQQGELQGYEVREYLLEKWGRQCAYCDAEKTPLSITSGRTNQQGKSNQPRFISANAHFEIDHIHPRSKGGSNRVSNLTLACHDCNQKKGNSLISEFLVNQPDRLSRILAQAKAPLNDAAAVNSTRWALYQSLKATGLPVEVGSGGRTKYNRHQLQVPKAHCLDAACVGHIDHLTSWQQPVLSIKATGRGSYQRTRLTKHGFPRGYFTRSKTAFGFQTGDMVKAVVTTGKKAGTYAGRVAIRASGSFNIQAPMGLVQGIHHRFCTRSQRADGYGYSWTQIASTQGDAGTGAARAAALSLHGLKAVVSRANG